MSEAVLRQKLTAAIGLLQEALAEIEPLEPVAPLPAPPSAPEPEPAPARETGALTGLRKPEAFYAYLRERDEVFGGKIRPAQFEGIEADLKLGAGRLPTSWMAYALATDYHETAHTMQPIHELGGRDYLAKYDTGRLAAALGNTPEADGDGILYAGRGKPQVTGRANYAKADDRLHVFGILKPGENLLTNPDLMLRMDVATGALIFGMLEGWYTGKTFRHYLLNPATRDQFAAARRIINGQDRAELIAGYALVFQEALRRGEWI